MPVLLSEPWVKLVEVWVTWTPWPLNVSAKLVSWLLKAVVLTLAMSLPMALRPWLKLRRALTPEVRVLRRDMAGWFLRT